MINEPHVDAIPRPASVSYTGGALELAGPFQVSADPGFEREHRVLAGLLQRAGHTSGAPLTAAIIHGYGFGREGYRVEIGVHGIRVLAETATGAFYGVQTLRQLLARSHSEGETTVAVLPLCIIEDRPVYTWRGFMLDVSRHFFSTAQIKHLLDLLAYHKLNVFHWHLTDDGGWRLPSRQYPRLTEFGGWRKKKDFLWDYFDIDIVGQDSSEPRYGGSYSEEEIREVVAYAAERHITVLPEIETPGHALAACWSYPEYTCTPEATAAFCAETKMARANVFCAGKDATFTFLENVLTEMFELFPSKIIHIGGDEVNKLLWKNCADCQRRMREEGLKDENELQSYFVRRIEAFLNKNGRTLMGWDEILEGGLAPNAMVMSWRGIAGGIEAAKKGHKVVMTPTSHCYFDYRYDIVSNERARSFDPRKGLSANEAECVIGGQANLWTEYVPDLDTVEERMFPRLAGTAEALWSGTSDRDEFLGRLPRHLERLESLGVHYFDPAADRPQGSFQDGVVFVSE